MRQPNNSHLLWIAREFGDPGYVPLSISDLRALEHVTMISSFGSGSRLYREGETADACFLIRSGEVRLQRDGGRPHINLAAVGRGQMIGDYAMLRNADHASTAIARSDVTAVQMQRGPTMDALSKHPRIGLRWLMEALGRLEKTHERLDALLRGSVTARVAAFLLSYNTNGGDVIEITHAGLAEMIGTERASVSRAIAALRDADIITNTRGSVRMLDREGLMAVRDS